MQAVTNLHQNDQCFKSNESLGFGSNFQDTSRETLDTKEIFGPFNYLCISIVTLGMNSICFFGCLFSYITTHGTEIYNQQDLNLKLLMKSHVQTIKNNNQQMQYIVINRNKMYNFTERYVKNSLKG